MHYIVTGATSFIGSHLTRLLATRGERVAIMMRVQSDPWRIADLLPGLTVLYSDLARCHELEQAITAFQPEVCIHVAWHGVNRPRRDDYEQVTQNLYGSLQLLETLRRAGCKSWIGIGSQQERVISDSESASSLYSATKSSIRLLSQRLCALYDMRWTWLRFATTYGPMDHPGRLIPYVILALLNRTRPALTSGSQTSPFVHVDDAADALYRASTDPAVSGVYDIGPEPWYAVREVVERIRDHIDPSLELGFGELAIPRENLSPAMDISPRSFGWTPRVNLDEGLARTVRWYRDNLERFT